MSHLARFINLVRHPIVPWLIALFCLAVAAFAATKALQATHDVSVQADRNSAALKEILINRDITCKNSESKHKREVENLDQTYRLLKDPPQVYKDILVNPIVQGQFRDTILAAANDLDTLGEFVSPACDDPGFGLPEPDPANPAVPAYVEKLLPGITKQVAQAEANGVTDSAPKTKAP